MNGFERIKKRKRADIKRAAAQLFDRYGVDKTSLSDIARQADVSPATIYNHFGGKNQLVREIIRELIDETVASNKKVIESNKPFPQKMREILFNKKEVVNSYDKELIQKLAAKDLVIEQLLNQIYEKDIKKLWTKMVEDGKKEGYIKPEISMEALYLYVDVFRKGTEGYVTLLGSPRGDDRLIEEIWQIFFYGLLTDKARQKAS